MVQVILRNKTHKQTNTIIFYSSFVFLYKQTTLFLLLIRYLYFKIILIDFNCYCHELFCHKIVKSIKLPPYQQELEKPLSLKFECNHWTSVFFRLFLCIFLTVFLFLLIYVWCFWSNFTNFMFVGSSTEIRFPVVFRDFCVHR